MEGGWVVELCNYIYHSLRQLKKLNTMCLHIKVCILVIAPLTWVRLVTSSALQSWKWQLIGMSQWCCSASCVHPLPVLTDNWTDGAYSTSVKIVHKFAKVIRCWVKLVLLLPLQCSYIGDSWQYNHSYCSLFSDTFSTSFNDLEWPCLTGAYPECTI